MPESTNLTVVDGSQPDGVSGALVVKWLERHTVADGRADVEVVSSHDPHERFAAAVDRGSAVVVVTPEYNHSFPGWLKIAIDRLRDEWVSKPVGFVTYGGRSGGLRAAEQLRLVFAELHAITIRETLGFADVRNAFDPQGEPHDPGLGAAHRQFLDVLLWWSDAIRAGHRLRDYPRLS